MKSQKLSDLNIGLSMQTTFSSQNVQKALKASTPEVNINFHYSREAICFIDPNHYDFMYEEDRPVIDYDHPEQEAKRLAIEFLATNDGIIIPGNDHNIDPWFYNESDEKPNFSLDRSENIKNRRALFEIALIEASLNSAKPVLGICGGIQVIAVALNAKIKNTENLKREHRQIFNSHTDSPPHLTDKVAFHAETQLHTLIHRIKVVDDNKIHWVIPKEDQIQFEVSNHEQAADPSTLPDIAIVSASDEEGIVKALEINGHPWLIGTQFHPEFFDYPPENDKAIFQNFASTCLKHKEQSLNKKLMHAEMMSINTDQDTLINRQRELLNDLHRIVNDNTNRAFGISKFFNQTELHSIFDEIKNLLKHYPQNQANPTYVFGIFNKVKDFLENKSSLVLQNDSAKFLAKFVKRFDAVNPPEVRVRANLKPPRSP